MPLYPPPSSSGPSITTGPYASLPATCATGDVYFLDDSFYTAVATATNTWSFFANGRGMTLPGTVASWTGVNVASDWTDSDATGAIVATIDRNASLNWRGLFKTQPSTPYTITFQMVMTLRARNSSTVGAYFYDGTKLMGVEFLAQGGTNEFRVQKITNVTTDGSTAATTSGLPLASTGGFYSTSVYYRLVHDGSALTFLVSLDGEGFVQLFSESVGTYITPTHYGFGGVNASSTSTDDVVIVVKSVVIS